MLFEKLRVTPSKCLEEIDKTYGSHVRDNYLGQVFTDEIRRVREDGNDLSRFPFTRGFL